MEYGQRECLSGVIYVGMSGIAKPAECAGRRAKMCRSDDDIGNACQTIYAW